MIVPEIENVSNLTLQEIDKIKSSGFCYVKIPDQEEFFSNENFLKSKAMNFFRSNEENKIAHIFKKKSNKQIDKYLISGYTDRRSKFENLETFRQDMNDSPNPPFDSSSEIISSIKDILVEKIAIGLSKKILDSLEVNENALNIYNSALRNPVAVLTFNYYPAVDRFNRLLAPAGINPHRDIDLLTVLLLEKPGLEAWVDGHWLPLLPRHGYALVIFGDDFSTLTKGKVRSCLHAVRSTGGEERLSIVSFISMDRSLPFILTDGIQLEETGAKYLDKRFYQHNVEIRLHAKSAFSYFRKQVNISYFFLSNLFAINILIDKNDKSISSRKSVNLFLSCAAGFSLINILLKAFSATYFERMILDILQYSEEPNFATIEKRQAYNLGKNSLSFLGMTKSFFSYSTYKNRSFWNAGFLSVFSQKFSDKESVKMEINKKSSSFK